MLDGFLFQIYMGLGLLCEINVCYLPNWEVRMVKNCDRGLENITKCSATFQKAFIRTILIIINNNNNNGLLVLNMVALLN